MQAHSSNINTYKLIWCDFILLLHANSTNITVYKSNSQRTYIETEHEALSKKLLVLFNTQKNKCYKGKQSWHSFSYVEHVYFMYTHAQWQHCYFVRNLRTHSGKMVWWWLTQSGMDKMKNNAQRCSYTTFFCQLLKLPSAVLSFLHLM